MQAQYDPITNLGGGVSIAPGASASGTTAVNGAWVDCNALDGPVYADCGCGAVGGAPSAFSLTFRLQEADAADGTGSQDLALQTANIVLTAINTSGFVIGTRTKRFVRAVAVPAFTAGTTPTSTPAANVRGQRRFVG
jgi:hypothetical protein